ncbi:MAG: hypothetical protein ACREX4_23665 [Gammaproteobacteria bacterium]
MANSALAGNTVVYKGSAQTNARKSLLPLANGDAVVTSESQGVTTISTDPPAILTIRCAGSGMVKGGKYSGEGHCTLSENDTDAFDLKVSDRPELATLEVIGGSRKWSGAAGKGTFTRVSVTGIAIPSRLRSRSRRPDFVWYAGAQGENNSRSLFIFCGSASCR